MANSSTQRNQFEGADPSPPPERPAQRAPDRAIEQVFQHYIQTVDRQIPGANQLTVSQQGGPRESTTTGGAAHSDNPQLNALFQKLGYGNALPGLDLHHGGPPGMICTPDGCRLPLPGEVVPKHDAAAGAPAAPNEIKYPNGHARTFGRSEQGDVNDIVTRDKDGHQLSHYVKDGGKWYYETPEGMRAKIEGNIQVSPRGDVSFETSPSTWRTERADGTIQTERTNPDGSRVAFTKDGKPERITRKDGSSVEATYKDDQLSGVSETDAQGKTTTWANKGDHFESSDAASKEQRKNVGLSADGRYSYDSSDGFKYTTTGDGAKIVDDLGLTTKRDAKGRVEEITYPGGKKSRTFGRDEQGNVNSITTRDEKGERTYVKDGNSWFLQMDGMNLKLPGNIQVNAKGDVSFETRPGLWSTERTNGQVVREASLDSGARVSVDKSGHVDKITRKDGSIAEASYGADGKPSQIKEYNADGSQATTWVKNGDQWQSYPPGQPARKNMELLPSGITVAQNADGTKAITLGDGKKLVEQPGKAQFSFDSQGRFESIKYPSGDTLKFKYDSSGLQQIEKERDGRVVRVNSRVGENRWETKDGNGKVLGTLDANYSVGSNGEVKFHDFNKTRNPQGYDFIIGTDGNSHKEKRNSDGSRTLLTNDKALVDVDKDGLVRRVTASKDNYRTFDYDDHGKLTKIHDFRKGKETSTWDSAAGPQRRDLQVRENGDVTYRTESGGAVIERATQSKIELDNQGYMTRVTQPNGNTRAFAYDNANGKHELVSITDTRHGEKKDISETWTRKKNSDGSYSNAFETSGQERSTRTDVVVGRDGDYQYKSSDGKLHVAKAGRDSSGGMSESVEEARERFLDSLEGKLDGKRITRAKEMMQEYEKRMSDRVEAQVAGGKDEATTRAAVEKTIAGTYDQLSGLVNPTDAEAGGQYFNQTQRVKLAENFLFLAQNPLEANQGNHGTCWIESGWIAGGMVQHTDHMARLLKEVSLTGKYTTLNSGMDGSQPKTVSFSRRLFQDPSMEGMNEEKHWTIDRAHTNQMIPGVPQTFATARSPVGMIFDQVLPVIGGRPEGRSTGGNFESDPRARYMDGRPVRDGSQNIMQMVTGHKIDIESEYRPDANKERQVLLEKGAVCDSPPGHLRTRQLKKVGDSWYVIQDDQHGNQNDHVMYKIKDLQNWLRERSDGNVRLHRTFSEGGDTTIGGMPGGRGGNDDDNPNPHRPRPRVRYW